jgi:hypothetical protein
VNFELFKLFAFFSSFEILWKCSSL